MANEQRLIDATPLAKNGWHLVQTGESNRFLASMSLADVPTVDAVEVVRCKDCKWYQIRKWDDGKPQYDCRKTHALLDVKPDDFCSYGERKGNA